MGQWLGVLALEESTGMIYEKDFVSTSLGRGWLLVSILFYYFKIPLVTGIMNFIAITYVGASSRLRSLRALVKSQFGPSLPDSSQISGPRKVEDH